MIVINTESAHQALPMGIHLLNRDGIPVITRNGPVMAAPCPVTTVYNNPLDKCVMWPERDVNIAFLIYESLWMLGGRNDVEPLQRYVHDFDRYSDDKKTLHGAYGYRWRHWFKIDQLELIIEQLQKDPTDRRNVLQMWDASQDLGHQGLDVPCNDIATFQIDSKGKLNMVVFCRSNDIIWGTYFANAFHFGILLEYMATKIGCQMGTYSQVSVNYHAYLTTLQPLLHLGEMCPFDEQEYTLKVETQLKEEYSESLRGRQLRMDYVLLDEHIDEILLQASTGFALPRLFTNDNPWVEAIYAVLKAHHVWRTFPPSTKYEHAFNILSTADGGVDWIILMKRWLRKRQHLYLAASN